MHATRHLSSDLEYVTHPLSLCECWVDVKRERDNAVTDPEFNPILAELDHKLATLTRWLLAVFESSPTVKAVWVPTRGVMLTPGNGEILIRKGCGIYDLTMRPCPQDPEDVVAPFPTADAVTDFNFMDDDMDQDVKQKREVA